MVKFGKIVLVCLPVILLLIVAEFFMYYVDYPPFTWLRSINTGHYAGLASMLSVLTILAPGWAVYTIVRYLFRKRRSE